MSPSTTSPVESLLQLPPEPDLLRRWAREQPTFEDSTPARGEGSASERGTGPLTDHEPRPELELLYQTLMHHARVDPGQTLDALDHVIGATRSALSRFERAFLDRLHGHALTAAGRSSEAAARYEAAAGSFRSLGASTEEGRTATGWTFALALCGRPEEALAVTRRGRRLLPEDDRLGRARLETNLGSAWQLAGQIERAIASYQVAERAFRKAGSERDGAVARHNLALLHRLLGDRKAARKHLQAAQETFTRLGQDVLGLYAATVLATLDLEEDRWDDGLRAIDTLRARFESLGDDRARAWLHRELGTLFAALGALAPALAEVEAAGSLFDRLGLRVDAAHARMLQGRLLLAKGSRQEAFARLSGASDEWRRTGGTWARHRVELEIARMFLDEGRTEDALPKLRAAQRYLDRRDPRGDGALCRALLARAALQRGHVGRAHELARRARTAATRYPARLERPTMTLLLARACAQRGRRGEALRWARRAVEEVEEQLLKFGTRGVRSLVGESREAIYGEAVDLVLELGGPGAEERALDLLSRARSPILVEDVLQTRATRASDPTRTALIRLRDELLSPGSHPEAEETRTAGLLNQLDRVARSGRRSVPRPPGLVRRALDARALDQWRSRLEGRALVVYDRNRDGWRAFHVTADAVRLVRLPRLATVLSTDWTALRLNLDTAARLPVERRRDFLERTVETARSQMQQLRSAAWDPLPHDGRATVVVPLGPLHSVPFEALDLQAGCVVSRLPHPALLRRGSRRSKRGQPRALLLSGPGTAARHEIEGIRLQLEGCGFEVATGDRRELLASSPGVDVLHVAAHGTFHRDAWLTSGLRLGDGWIGFEHLRPELIRGALVQFTSCESALAEQMPGSDIEGWITTGLAAGAAAMILTLWKIDDRAAHAFSRSFYEAWTAGSTPAEAVREASRHLERIHHHPYHWAPFAAIG